MKKVSKKKLVKSFKENAKLVVIVMTASAFSSLVTLGIVTVSAHGGDTNKVHACIKNNTLFNASNVRIVGVNDTCNNNETALDWPKVNTPGFGSLSDVEVVWKTSVEFDDDGAVAVTCPSGKIVLGGGVRGPGDAWLQGFPTGPNIPDPTYDSSGSASSATGWQVFAGNNTGGPNTAFAICAKVN